MKNNIFMTLKVFLVFTITASLLFIVKTHNKLKVTEKNVYSSNNQIINSTEEKSIDLLVGENYEIFENDSYKEEKLINQVQYNVTVFEDNETGEKYVTYEEFEKYLNEKNDDDYELIKITHEYANKYGYEVRATKKEYNIYNKKNLSAILISTNVNWNGANFIIHDENLESDIQKQSSIFKIDSERQNVVIEDKEILKNITINKRIKKIPQLAGYGNMICMVYNNEKKQFIRSGYNNSYGTEQKDIFRIDNDGNVLNDIQWDFSNVSLIRLVPITAYEINISNGNFITILSGKEEKKYIGRNILCNRSNTIIRNVTHTVDNAEKVGGPYYGFIRISHATNVEIRDCELYTHKYNQSSSYDLIIENSTDIMLNNVISNDIEDTRRWGITGSNYTKDVVYYKCTLNRIDAHCGVYNLTIDNCVVGVKGITIVGGGKLNISDTLRKRW